MALMAAEPDSWQRPTSPATSAVAALVPPSTSTRSTSRPSLAKSPCSWAYSGTLWVLDTLEWQTVRAVGAAASVGATALAAAAGADEGAAAGSAGASGGVQPASHNAARPTARQCRPRGSIEIPPCDEIRA